MVHSAEDDTCLHDRALRRVQTPIQIAKYLVIVLTTPLPQADLGKQVSKGESLDVHCV